MPDSFASTLRQYRNDKGFTQEEVAAAIGRKKMLISMFERGVNAPPTGELLEKLVASLMLTEEEADVLRFFSAKERNELPSGLEDYFFSTDAISKFIRIAKEIGIGEEGWSIMLDDLVKRYGIKA